MTTSLKHVFSCGGGVQSTACLVLAAQGKIPYRTFIFANVGDQAESPLTIKYINEVLKPYAQENDIQWVDTSISSNNEQKRDLYTQLLRTDIKSIGIPVHLKGSGPAHRDCTAEYKIRPIAKWMRANANGGILGKGISTDEPHRATPSRETDCYTSTYPLIDLGISRSDCLVIAKEAGLPQPPKSSCWFCPFKTTDQWTIMRREMPILFEQASDLEDKLNEKRMQLGKDEVYLSGVGARRSLRLREVIPDQLGLFPEWLDEQDGCESGYCMT
jgi:hypothetical protein